MPRTLFLLLVVAVLSPAVSAAGVPPPGGGPCDSLAVGLPDPSRSTVGLSSPNEPCQYRFRADGGLDVLEVRITLRDSFDVPVENCETSAILVSQTGFLCGCEPLTQTGFTAPDGTLDLVFARLGGHGDLDVVVMEHCCGDITIATIPIVFTSPDLDGSCETLPLVATTVADLALFAFSLPPGPYALKSDYDCSGHISIPDLAIWAGGLSEGCGP